jgi:primosomal protein N''
MLDAYTDEQLLSHLTGLGQWTKVRAQELYYFTEHLPATVAEAKGDPVKETSTLYALKTYIGAVQEMANRCREAQVELERRISVKA